MRSKFDQQLAALNQELTEMGATCAQAIGLAAQALEQQDVALAAPEGQLEEQTNEQERTIEALCLKLLLQQQPVARDLRQISAALKMITDMERIGELTLRESHIFAQKGYILSADIVQPVFCFVDEHKTASETFSACQ